MGSRRRGHKICPSDIHEARMRAGIIPNFKDADKFIDAKIKMLKEDFLINLTDDDIAHLRKFKTENDINAAVRSLVNKYWR